MYGIDKGCAVLHKVFSEAVSEHEGAKPQDGLEDAMRDNHVMSEAVAEIE